MNLNSSSKLGSPRIETYATHVKWVSAVKYGVPKRTCPLIAVSPYFLPQHSANPAEIWLNKNTEQLRVSLLFFFLQN